MKEHNKLISKFKRKDLILIISILCLGIILLLIFNSFSKEGNTVRVTINNHIISSYSLNDNITKTLSFPDGSYNILVIENHSVSIIEADCPDLICVKQHKINRIGETIVCLPHKLIIEIVDE